MTYIEEDEFFEGGSPTQSPDLGESNPVNGTDTEEPFSRWVYSWGLDRLDDPAKLDRYFHSPCNLTGRGVDVYVLDTGIHYANSEFEGRALYSGCDIIDEVGEEDRNGSDCNKHGTAVAATAGGIQHGVAPGSTLFSVRVLNCDKRTMASVVVRGLECMLDHHAQRPGRPAVVNMSLFGRKAKMIKRAIDRVIGSGVSVVTLSGNVVNPGTQNQTATQTWLVRDSCKVTPGSIHGVITVAGSTINNSAFESTKMGTCVDLFAPGKDVVTAAVAGTFCPRCQITFSGGSFAAPHVTGAVALLLERCPSIQPWRVKHLLLSKMTVANVLDMSTIRRRYRRTTPNLSLHLSSAMCDIEC